MKMGQNMTQTGLQSLFVLLLVAVQYVGGQDLAGVLSALQGQAGEVLVKGDSVGWLIASEWMKITLDRTSPHHHHKDSMLRQILLILPRNIGVANKLILRKL